MRTMNLAAKMHEKAIDVVADEDLWVKTVNVIEERAEEGKRDHLVCYTDCVTPKWTWLMEKARDEGFEISRKSENINGVQQYPGWYIEW